MMGKNGRLLILYVTSVDLFCGDANDGGGGGGGGGGLGSRRNQADDEFELSPLDAENVRGNPRRPSCRVSTRTAISYPLPGLLTLTMA
jgi:hypothetical protein